MKKKNGTGHSTKQLYSALFFINCVHFIDYSPNGKTIVYAEDKLKTKSSYRTLPLIPVVEEKLLEHKAKLERNQKLFGNSYCKEYMDYVGSVKLFL